MNALLQSALSRARDFVTDARGLYARAARALGTSDGRWMMVSTSLTASVAFATTWLALGATPESSARAYEPKRQQAALPYELLLRLTGSRAAVPGIAAEDSAHLYREAGIVTGPDLVGPIERMLAAEREAIKPPTETKTLKVSSGGTIMGMLQQAGASNEDAAAVIAAMKPLYSARNLKSGQMFEATFGSTKDANPPAEKTAAAASSADDSDQDRRLLSLSFSPSIDRQITVSLTAPDGYLAHDVQRKLENHYQHAGATIDSSLYLSAMQAGIPANVVVELIRMFSYEVDFQRDVHPGDEFEIFFNHYFTDGLPAKPGEVLAASMTLAGKKHVLYRYELPDGVEYFGPQGESTRSMLMKTPVDGARISSGYGARLHPILGYTRMHKGIDFAVPSGTPVMAAGSGTVTFAGPAGEYGNFVIISHGNGYATAYGHLSRFAVRTGARVRQGEVVAYSGMTGLATGPHLHYEIRVNNNSVNPGLIKVASGRKLQGEELHAFATERSRIDTLMASMPIEHKLAELTELRASTTR
ncbi:MAG TPA: M23 family metallopeptidase [Micropepsaceae bacterium]|nr:M23 family metallopeptidase [Micropepsaceae bacterium]